GVRTDSLPSEIERAISWPITLGTAIVFAVIVLLVDYLTPNKKLATLFSVFVGLLAAMLATIAIGFIIDLLVTTYDIKAAETLIFSIKVLLGIALAYLGITTVLQTQDDFRLVIPYVEFSRQVRGSRPLIIDTSALVDGRLADIASTNFLLAPIIIPRFVLLELQTLADSSDPVKRAKGRRGLDIASRLQRSPKMDVSIDETQPSAKSVDQAVVELARAMSALVVTLDSGLARIADLQGVSVLNINDLASSMKPAFVAGEVLSLKLVRRGEQAQQAVGYLPDGTMVVAENGAAALGETVSLTVTATVQTSAGRLIFGRIPMNEPASEAGTRATGAFYPETTAPTQSPMAQSSTTGDEPAAASESHPETDAEPPTDGHIDAPPGSPYPPRPPRSLRSGTPRNPRR
ncbi:MAG: hypothetical protein PSX37_10650, partial [bacterium]|nr:hypothetical protein [bacterium]